jgi:large subunit ribosomal protein L25
MESIKIEGNVRTALGKRASRDTRTNGEIPCVIYGGTEIQHFSAPSLAFRSLVYTPDFKVAEIKLENKTFKAIVKEIQFNPLNDKITHIDFLELIPGKRIKAEIPVNVQGSSIGVKKGGKLVANLRKVKIKTLVENLVNEVTVDITELDLGKSIRVRDIKIVEGVEILNSPSTPLATIEIPRALRAQQAEEAKAATAPKKGKK